MQRRLSKFKREAALLILAPAALGMTGNSQEKRALSTEAVKREEMSGSLEEVAMCDHAIRAAHHYALASGQNPYYRYVLSYMGMGHNAFPSPERCKNYATSWILTYTKLDGTEKAVLDKAVSLQTGMTVPEMASDVEFLDVVITKMLVEGEDARFVTNADKDIPMRQEPR